MTLRAFLLSWWRPPDFEDLENRRVAALTLPLATIFAVCVALWIPAAISIYRFSLWPMLSGLFALAYASAALLVRAGRADAGAQLFVTTAFLSTTAGVAAAGIAGPVPSLYALSVIAAGLLLRTRLALVLALAGIGCSAAIGFAHARSWLPAPATDADPFRDLLIHGTIVMLSLAIVWLAVRAMREYDARLAESGARFRALTENAPDLIAELDADGTVLYASPGYARVLGYGVEELRRQRLETIVHPDDLASARGVLGRILAGDGDIVSLRLRDRAGAWHWFDFEGSAFDDAGGARRVVTFGRDVTETRELQEQLQRAQRLDALGRLAAEVAHDFNNNLTVILGAAEWLRDEIPKRSPLGERVAEIEEAARRSAAITQQLLAFGRRQPFHPRVVDLNRLLAGIESVLRRLLPEGIAIDSVHTAEASRVRIDPAQLEQALLNLALNARDAMPDGGTLTLETANVLLDPENASRHEVRPGRYVVLAVADTGSGMDPETAAHAFEPFFTTKPTGKGTGLGLSTVHGIVRQNRGHTEIDTRPGEGTTVKIFLPRVDQEPELAEPPPLEAPDLRGSETVLLVEDAELVRVHVRLILEANGYRVLEATDGGEALALAGSHPEIDAVITDLMLPILGGGELARRLRQARPGLAIVFVTSNTENGTASRELPAAPLVRKPFTSRELLRALRRALTPS
jgi:PAS domain S-box-containing protein